MAITPGSDIVASDFINNSEKNATPANDAGRVAKFEADGRIKQIFLEQAFGDGADGAVTLNGSTDYTSQGFGAPSSNIYTMTRDVFCTDLTINSGVTLRTVGYRIFVSGTISGAGKIEWNGNNGSNGTYSGTCDTSGTCANGNSSGGAGGTAVTGYFSNVAGGAGGNAQGCTSGAGGTAGGACFSALGANGQNGGGGANSPNGSGSGGSGGTGGTATAPKVKVGLVKWLTFLALDIDHTNFASVTGATVDNSGGEDDFRSHTHTIPITIGFRILGGSAGAGGGGAGGANTTGGNRVAGSGGGGGATGGIIFIAARIWAGTFEIEAHGGNGGDGGNTPCAGGSGGGGGAGGNGGCSIVLYERKTWTGSYDLAAGTGGAAGTGVNNGTAGTNGTTGTSYEIYVGNTM